MNKADLKKIIKPVVKECIHEVLLEEGLLSNVVAEVAKGMQGNLVVESVPLVSSAPRKPVVPKNTRKKIDEHRKKLMNSIDKDAYNGVNLFEGTEPMSRHESSTPKAGAIDLGNPHDAGVDISSLMGGAREIWKAMK
tara:strand:- start:1698 stop:2108 length:411 start_codon:yes stop_codon:yes gene_type:complete